MMGIAKQAKTLTPHQIKAVLNYLDSGRNSYRNKVIFLLSIKSGFRAKEIASLQWNMIVNADHSELGETINLSNFATKGNSGRVISINKELRSALIKLYSLEQGKSNFDVHSDYVVTSERSKKTSPQVIVNMFQSWYQKLGFVGCSSHSGRRTFITNAARKISTVGGSLRDVQILAGHSNLQTTQKYIEFDSNAQKSIVDLI